MQWNWLFQSSNQDKKDHGLQQSSSGNQREALIVRLCENSPSSFSKSNNKKPALATQCFILIEEQLQMYGALSTQVYFPGVEPENHHQVSTQHRYFCCLAVLSVVGSGLSFFRTICRVLGLTFVTEPVLTAHQCFIYCWTSLLHPWVGWGWVRVWEGAHLGPLSPKDQRHSIPYDIMLSNNTSGGEGEESFQSCCCCQWALLARCCDEFFG